MSSSITQSEWDISTDVYSIVEMVDKLKSKYVEDEEETTLALGIFGFLGDIEAKKIQTSTIMAGELGNEMFPARAKLTKNVLAHAIYCNIDGINATPARMTVNVGVRESDLEEYMVNNEFIFSKETGLFIGNYEYHFDYDIKLKRYKPTTKDRYVYTAIYDMDEKNNISQINNAYLTQPMNQNFNNINYIFFTTQVHQVHIEYITDTLLTDSIIDNKTYSFSFTDQLADFELYVTEDGVRTRLTPLFYGSPIENTVDKYCWYLYTNDNTVRIGFDYNSYMPGMNAELEIIVRTTQGAEALFQYKDNEENDIYCDFISQYTRNKKITCYIRCATGSEDGKDAKSVEELKALIPKMALSRGYITTETDLNNYFNIISDEDNLIRLQKKVDNQLYRIWYAYYLMRDENNNIIPTNTIHIHFDPTASYVRVGNDNRYVIPAGTVFRYDRVKDVAEYIDESSVPDRFSDEYYYGHITYDTHGNEEDWKGRYFYYKTIQNIVVNDNPLYAAYYMTNVNKDSYFNYYWVNEDAYIGFTTIRNHFERTLLNESNDYRFTFTITQSINEDFGLLIADDEGEVTDCKIKVFLVIYDEGEPYRYQECELTEYSLDGFSTSWRATLTTDNEFDRRNKLQLTNVFEYGLNGYNAGFFSNNSQAYIYIAAKLDEVYKDEDMLLSKLCPGLDDYSLISIYEIEGGLTFYENFTDVINTKVVKNTSPDQQSFDYDIFHVPMVGLHYFNSEDNVAYLINCLSARKRHIDYCASIIENTMKIDFKFFNSYGNSKLYTLGDKEKTRLDHIDLELNFRLKLSGSSDLATKDSIRDWIKNYIEDLNKSMQDFHIPNLIHDLKEVYGESIVYIEYMNYNQNRLGIQHIELVDIEDVNAVPEFINVRNKLADDGVTLVPCIDIELVTN